MVSEKNKGETIVIPTVHHIKCSPKLILDKDSQLAGQLAERLIECSAVYPMPQCCVARLRPDTGEASSFQFFSISQGIAVDIGAHIGAFSLIASSHFDKVYAFEPVKENYDNMNFLLSRATGNISDVVSTYNLAVGANNKENINIYIDEKQTDSCSIYPDSAPSYTKKQCVEQVNLEKIYEIIEEDFIDYLKIDIEGAEYDFLYGKDMSKIKHISLEVGGPPLDIDIEYYDLIDFLVENFYPSWVQPNHFHGINRRYMKHLNHDKSLMANRGVNIDSEWGSIRIPDQYLLPTDSLKKVVYQAVKGEAQ